MKRIIFIFALTVLGIVASFYNAYWGLLVHTWYAFASPLELTYGELVGKRLSLIVGAVVVATTYHQRRTLVAPHLISLLGWFFVLQCACSLASTGNFSVGFIFSEIELIAKIVLIMTLTPVLVDTLERLRGYILTIAVSTGLLGAYYGFFGIFAGQRELTGAGRIGDNNGYAVTLAASLPFIFYAGRYVPLAVPQITRGVVTAGIFGSNMIALVLTFSRGGFLAGCATVFVLLFRVRSFAARFLGWGVLFPIIVIGTWKFFEMDPKTAFMPSNPNPSAIEDAANDYIRRLMTLRRGPDDAGSASGRLHFWKVAFNMLEESPVFGVGLGRYRAEYDKYDFSKGSFGPARAVHNTFFSVMAEIGAVGLLLYLGLLLICLISLFRARRLASRLMVNKTAARELKDYADMTIIALFGFIVGSFFVTTLYQEIFWSMLSISIALEMIIEKTLRQETGASA